MEDLVTPNHTSFWKGKRVLITGHTGFKGSWLSLWLQQLGAELCGYALEPPSSPSLFADAHVETQMRSIMGDVRDLECVKSVLKEWKPEIVIHMAAQSLVRASYVDPVGTYATNVMGTAHVLEAVRACTDARAVVVVTSDKCYENKEWPWPYRETDTLGGHDPYSNSKAAAELVVSAYRTSFFHPVRHSEHQVALASVRAGNVIGGGDWADDRLIPDIMRAFLRGQPVEIRNPASIRPWQHVLEPLRGYLRVAQELYLHGADYGQAWNFGPNLSDARPVEFIVDFMAKAWGKNAAMKLMEGDHPHEARLLKLDCSKAAALLSWRPALTLTEALRMTIDWYSSYSEGANMSDYTLQQIRDYARNVDTEFGKTSKRKEPIA